MKHKFFLLSSFLLFLYLLAVGGHLVAARWWLSLNAEIPPYLDWWNIQLNTTSKVVLGFFLPALLYSGTQLRFLRRAWAGE